MAFVPLSLAELNALEEEEFVARIGPVYERSPWIARETWRHRPFVSVEQLRAHLYATLRAAPPEVLLELIRAYPDPAGRLTRTGRLTLESFAEQHSAGLDRLTPEEAAEFDHLNRAYMQRFGFPFVICARRNDRTSILAAFQHRLENSPGQEIETALDEIYMIAGLRLAQIVHD